MNTKLPAQEGVSKEEARIRINAMLDSVFANDDNFFFVTVNNDGLHKISSIHDSQLFSFIQWMMNTLVAGGIPIPEESTITAEQLKELLEAEKQSKH